MPKRRHKDHRVKGFLQKMTDDYDEVDDKTGSRRKNHNIAIIHPNHRGIKDP